MFNLETGAPCWYVAPMHIHLSPQTIEALAQVISGGSGDSPEPPIGIYRSGPKLESFMRGCGIGMHIGSGSRLPTLSSALEQANREGDPAKLRTIIERSADPRDFADQPAKLQNVLTYLNARLRYDDLELQLHGRQLRLMKAGTGSAVIEMLSSTVTAIDFDTVQRDLDRAISNAETDPEDAVTAACAVVESVCRSILVELGQPLPTKKDMKHLYKAVREPLGLSPDRKDLPEEIADDIRTILGGLVTTAHGIGSLRTHGGDAHGRERGYRGKIDARIARLAIHAAGALTLFLIESWQRRSPSRELHPH